MTDNEALIDRLVECSRLVKRKKGEILFSPGVTCSSTIFLLDGVIKTYIRSPDGTENTLAFLFQPGTCVAMHEDMINIPKTWCKTMSPCTLIEMSPGPYELADEFPELWKHLVTGWRPFYYGMMDKLRVGYTLTAKERYLWFMDKYAPIIDYVPQAEIARFLGIKPQSLSRIRNELAEEGRDQS
ncbi:MAG: Crp/Fnr family transcriptional regulator [Ruminococcaceae bacterium]|nr:Crp/Fnr family transcriptional regulator [Oscillospiraceae bacterium]